MVGAVAGRGCSLHETIVPEVKLVMVEVESTIEIDSFKLKIERR
jgi:hypothetical protein